MNIHHQPLAFIDIETTGGSSSNSRIIDIGIIRVENGRVVRTMNQLINPERHVPGSITNLTGITNQMVWSAPTFAGIASELEDILDGAIFIAHYVQFDYSFIKAEFERAGVNFNHDRACTVKLSRLTHPEQRRHGLDYVIKRMKLDVTNRHRGYDDAEVLWRYFKSEMDVDAHEIFKKLESIRIKAHKNKYLAIDQLNLL